MQGLSSNLLIPANGPVPSLSCSSPRGAVGSSCAGEISHFPHPHTVPTSGRNSDGVEPTSSKSKHETLIRCNLRSRHLAGVAMRTVSHMNLARYLGAIYCLLHCECRLRESGTKSGQDHITAGQILGRSTPPNRSSRNSLDIIHYRHASSVAAEGPIQSYTEGWIHFPPQCSKY